MRRGLLLIGAVACLVGCTKAIPESHAPTSSGSTVVTGYSSEGHVVTLLNGELPLLSLPGPNEADEKYVTQLSETTKSKVIAFIGQDADILTFEAARPYGRILLLDVSERGVDDGNAHIVYDLKREVVIGYFAWYMQG